MGRILTKAYMNPARAMRMMSIRIIVVIGCLCQTGDYSFHQAWVLSTEENTNSFLLHSQPLEHRIHRISVKAGLEFGKEFSRDSGDVPTLLMGRSTRLAPASKAS